MFVGKLKEFFGVRKSVYKRKVENEKQRFTSKSKRVINSANFVKLHAHSNYADRP